MARNSIPQRAQSREDDATTERELSTFDEYTLDSFARGWDSAARDAGNPRAHRRPPIPGTYASYDAGRSLAEILAGLDL